MQRARVGASRAKVARDLGVHDHTLRSWESGHHDIPLQRALELCKLYGITISELIGEPSVTHSDEQLAKALEVAVDALRRGATDQ